MAALRYFGLNRNVCQSSRQFMLLFVQNCLRFRFAEKCKNLVHQLEGREPVLDTSFTVAIEYKNEFRPLVIITLTHSQAANLVVPIERPARRFDVDA